MDITKILEADHRQVEELFAKLDSVDGEERSPLIDELATALRGHMQLEEDVLYPAMRPITGDEAVEEGETEHKIARSALDQVVALAPDEPGFGAALESLKAAITHHVEEEEDDVFPQLRDEGQAMLDELASSFISRRDELGLPITAEGLSSAANKDELVEQAEAAGVERPAAMTKADLAETLASDSS